MNTSKFFLDIIAIFSVFCCFAYIYLIARKAWEKRFKPLNGTFLDKRAVILMYNGSEIAVILHFYTDGLIFEKDNGKKLYAKEANILKLSAKKVSEKFIYNMKFNPEISQKDSFDIISHEDITNDFVRVVKSEKLNIDI